MNKEVIYLEPEDDITDILTKLQQAEQKLVALVPPKKATILRSAVNMKLVARVAKECEKVVVIVTADPAIVKMAMAAQIPVAKTLQSRPVVPTKENVEAAQADEQVIDEDLEEKAESKKSSKDDKAKNAAEAANSNSKKGAQDLELTEEGLEGEAKKAQDLKNKKKKATAKKENASFVQKYRKFIIAGSVAAVALVLVLVWAFVFAPAANVVVAISSTSSNFSQEVKLTTDKSAQNFEENILFAEQISLDKTYKADITATGKEDRGERATGRLTLTVQFKPKEYMGAGGYGVTVTEGERFVNSTNGLVYIATSAASNTWDGETMIVSCDNGTLTSGSAFSKSCVMSVTVSVEAESGGAEYNVSANSKWLEDSSGAVVTNGSPIAGGTTDLVKTISDEDINKVKEQQLAEHSEDGKEALLDDLGEEMVAIETSFKSEVVDVKTTPEKGEEVKDNITPEAEVKITYSILAVKVSEIKEYIEAYEQDSLGEDQKIYDVTDIYFERFNEAEGDVRLKAVKETGPTVTKEDILEKVRGMKTGEAQKTLNAINGVSTAKVTTSYFWVWSVPKDENKITIDLVVEDKK